MAVKVYGQLVTLSANLFPRPNKVHFHVVQVHVYIHVYIYIDNIHTSMEQATIKPNID